MGDKEKKFFLFLLVVFFGFCVLFAVQKIKSFDIWWHLKTGEWIWQHKAVPYIDPFSYTFQGAEWIDFEWLFQAVIYPIYQLGGFEGLIIFKIIVVFLTFMFLFFTCGEVDGGRQWLSVTLLFIALLVAHARFMVRPDIIFLLFLALYGYLLILHRDEKITTCKLIFLLLPIHVLWVNFHGSFLMGILLVGVYALGRFVPLAISHHRDLKPVFQDSMLRSLLFLCLLLCLVSFLNPHTYQAFLIPLKTARAQEALKGIAEWQPVNIKFLGVFTLDRTMWFRVLFLVGVASFLMNRRNNFMRVENILIFVLFSYMAFKHIRFFGVFAIAVTPIIVYNLATLRWRIGGWKWIRWLPLIVIVGFCVRDIGVLITLQRLGFGVQRYYPEATVDFLKEHNIQGRIYNHYDLGGYLIWHLYPEIPVFIDGRTPTIYDQDFFWLYDMGGRKKEVWEEIIERYGVEIVLMRDQREEGYAELFHRLDEDENWRLVAFDDVSILYMKKSPRFNGLLKKYGFRYLRPSDLFMGYAKENKEDIRYLKALEKELEEACQRFPRDFYPFYYLGFYHQMYGTRDHLQEAEKALRKAVTNRPLPVGYYELGFTLKKLGQYNEAVEALKKAIKLQPKLPADAFYYLGASLFQRDDIDEAITSLEKYKKRARSRTRVEAYDLLGKAYMRKYKFRKALSCFIRVRDLGEASWGNYFDIGVAYFGLNQLEKARESFEQAMELKSDEIRVVYNLAVTYEKLGFFERAKNLFINVVNMEPKSTEEELWVEKAREKAQ